MLIHQQYKEEALQISADKEEARKKMDADYESDDDFAFTIRTLDDAIDNTKVTEAWRTAFPDYIISGYHRELKRLLSMVNERVDIPGVQSKRGEMPVDMVCDGLLTMLAAGAVPVTGVIIEDKELDPMTEGCLRLIGAMEVLLKYGDRLGEMGGLGGLMGITGPEELQEGQFWGESQACSVM